MAEFGVAFDPDGNVVVSHYLLSSFTRLGTPRWTLNPFEWDGFFLGDIAIDANGVTYAVDCYGVVYAVDTNGILLWHYQLPVSSVRASLNMGNDGTLVVYCDRWVFAFDQNGRLRWSTDVSYAMGNVVAPPAIATDGRIYISTYNGRLTALDPDGTIAWTIATGKYGMVCPAIGADGTIYASFNDGTGIDIVVAAPDGTYTTVDLVADESPDYPVGAIAVGSDGVLYFNTVAGSLIAVDLATEVVLWVHTTESHHCEGAGAFIGGDGTIYYITHDYTKGTIRALSPAGEELWTLDFEPGGTQRSADTSSAISPTGMLVSTGTYIVFAVPEVTGAIVTGTVIDASNGNVPLAGATVVVGNQTVTTDEFGAYTVELDTQGLQSVSCAKAGYVTVAGEIALEIGVTYTVNFSLRLATIITGVVRDAYRHTAGFLTPIAGATVTIGGVSGTTDETGAFSINLGRSVIEPEVLTATCAKAMFITASKRIAVHGVSGATNFMLWNVSAYGR